MRMGNKGPHGRPWIWLMAVIVICLAPVMVFDVLPVLKHREDVKYHHAALGQSETYPSAPANP